MSQLVNKPFNICEQPIQHNYVTQRFSMSRVTRYMYDGLGTDNQWPVDNSQATSDYHGMQELLARYIIVVHP